MEQKNILVIGFNAGGNPFCPVYSRLEDFELPDPGAQFENDAACRWSPWAYDT